MSDLEQFGQLPDLPRNEEGPMFAEPWQLTAFSIVVNLHERGHFEWREWVNYLSDEIALGKDYGSTDLNTIYYSQWLAALEKFVNDKGLSSFDELVARKEQWRNADEHRDFGKPLELGGDHGHGHHHHHHHGAEDHACRPAAQRVRPA